jgi:glycosyltransferase involved in cell wall biosynthesis
MRILVIANLYPTPASPAFGSFVGTRVAALRAAGAEVAVTAVTDPAVHRHRATKYARLALAAARRIPEASWGRSIDVVEAHIAYPTGIVAYPVAHALRAPLVLCVHGADVLRLARRGRVHRRIAQELLRRADLVLANSRFIARQAAGLEQSAEPKTVVISPGIDLPLFATRSPLRDEHPRDGVLFVGRLVPDKGAAVLLDALAILRTRLSAVPRLTIIGAGPERRRLQHLAHAHRLEVAFTGTVPPAVVAAAMQRSLVLAVPSTAQEPLGLVAIEAMAAGAVVVASATGGLTETVVDGRNGYTVPPGRAQALATGLEQAFTLACRPGDYRALRAAARATAERHAAGLAARRSLALYQERWP